MTCVETCGGICPFAGCCPCVVCCERVHEIQPRRARQAINSAHCIICQSCCPCNYNTARRVHITTRNAGRGSQSARGIRDMRRCAARRRAAAVRFGRWLEEPASSDCNRGSTLPSTRGCRRWGTICRVHHLWPYRPADALLHFAAWSYAAAVDAV